MKKLSANMPTVIKFNRQKMPVVFLSVIIFAILTGCAATTGSAGGSGLWFPVVSIPTEESVEESTPYPEPHIQKPYIPAQYTPPAPTPAPTATPVPRQPMIALTFDDGPGRFTNRILDSLEEHGGQVTFFVLGYRVERYPDTVMRAANLGNEIANHSWSHPRLPQLSVEAITSEIERTSAAIEAVVGYSPSIKRPPFGRTCDRVRTVAGDLGYSLVNWTLDTLDWRYRDADRIYDVIINQAEDGAVVLMHDIHATTAEAMERVIPRLIAEGYRLVTVSELLEYFYGELEPGRVYGKLVEVD